jgi:hypothetical protein
LRTKYPKRLRLTITESHVQDGKRKNDRCCPLALALRSRFPGSGACVFVPEAWESHAELLPLTASPIKYKPSPHLDLLIRAFDTRRGGAAASRAALVGTYTLTRIDP